MDGTATALTPSQHIQLKSQILSFKYVSRNVTLPSAALDLIQERTNEAIQRESTAAALSNTRSSQRAAFLQGLGVKDNLNEHLRISYEIELKSLMLLPQQRALRRRVASEMVTLGVLAATSNAVAYRKSMRFTGAELADATAPQHILEARNRANGGYRQAAACIINEHRSEFLKFHEARRAVQAYINRHVSTWHVVRERERAAQAEKQARDRMQALKANDEEAYLRLLKETKNERLTALLAQTDEFLAQLGAKVQSEKDLQHEMDEKERVEAGGAPSEDPASATNEEVNKEVPAEKAEWIRWIESKNKYYAIVHKIKEVIPKQPDMLTGGDLKQYQMIGLQWMVSLYNNGLNGILADEMGLGKTIQTIALIAHLMEKKNQMGPYLIIVPLSTLPNWEDEFRKWAPSVKVMCYKGLPAVRKSLAAMMQPGKFNVCLTTYDYIMRDRPILSRLKWNYIIIDEGHRMKNSECKLHLILGQHYKSRHRLLLTGTPLQNGLRELWALLNFLLPSVFHSADDFENWFNAPFATMGERVDLTEEEQLLVIHRLHQVLRPFLLRRLKSEVLDQLPDKREMVIKCELSSYQKIIYKKIQDGDLTVVGKSGKASRQGLANTLVQLRKICNHPYMFFPPGPDDPITQEIVRSSGKFELLDRMLPKLKAGNHKVLIFSQFTTLLDIMEDYLAYRDYTFLRLDGSTKSDDRGELLSMFSAKGSEYFVFLLSTRAGGLGLNLQVADTVILFDSDWNPHMDMQAQARAHRIGQKNEVLVFRMLTITPMEQYMLDKATFKLDVDAKVIQAGKFNSTTSDRERHEMLEELLSKSNDDDVGKDEIPNDLQLNKMLMRSDQEFAMFQRMDSELEDRRAAEWLSTHPDKPVPPRLMQLDEVPEHLLVKHIDVDETRDFGRGHRDRGEVKYGADTMSDAQFDKFLDEGGELSAYVKSRSRALKARALRDALESQVLPADAPVWKHLVQMRRKRWSAGSAFPEPSPHRSKRMRAVHSEMEKAVEAEKSLTATAAQSRPHQYATDADIDLLFKPIKKPKGPSGRPRGRPRRATLTEITSEDVVHVESENENGAADDADTVDGGEGSDDDDRTGKVHKRKRVSNSANRKRGRHELSDVSDSEDSEGDLDGFVVHENGADAYDDDDDDAALGSADITSSEDEHSGSGMDVDEENDSNSD
eukprot:TRINITY_DN2530_c0_g1_i3.p1 TRINITY_DN2530_c0_g1~~TRINITY_DN2530_c0_g1_i3.p1  ORF type:complete len:1174 (+),score=207.58 TRINITY_DN2530_c0_g1_i3:3464-6985(+)